VLMAPGSVVVLVYVDPALLVPTMITGIRPEKPPTSLAVVVLVPPTVTVLAGATIVIVDGDPAETTEFVPIVAG